jgi:Flp pilus assembly protein TadD
VYRDLLASQPDDLVALNNLANVLIRGGDGCAEALALVARAIELDPSDPNLIDTRAQGLLCLGRLDEAERASRLAVSERSDDPRLLVTLIKVMVARSRWDAAEAELTRAESMLGARPPTDEVAAELETLRQEIATHLAPATP